MCFEQAFIYFLTVFRLVSEKKQNDKRGNNYKLLFGLLLSSNRNKRAGG